MAKNQILSGLIKEIKFRSNLTQTEIAAQIGVSKQYLSDTLNGRYPFSDELKQKLYEHYTYLSGTQEHSLPNADSIPYYKEVPVSAGRAELMEVEGEENAVGFIKITGVSGKFAFPVIGCSMEPVIHAGDIVVEKSGGSPTQSTGRVAYISQELIDSVGPVVCSNFCVAFRAKEKWNSLFVFYYLQYVYNCGVFFNFEGKTSGLKTFNWKQLIKQFQLKM